MQKEKRKSGQKHSEETRRKISDALKNRPVSEETRRKIGIKNMGNTVWRGRKHTEEAKKKIGAANKGKKPWTTGKHLSLETRAKIAQAQRGEKSHRWRGGVSSQNEIIRKSGQYKGWRNRVFQRDDYQCQSCGLRGGAIHADHIKPFSLFPELRFDLDNGRTLCVECHKKTDTYGAKIREYADAIKTLTELL